MDNDMTPNDIATMPPPTLDQLERQLIAALYAVWRAQGKEKRVVEIRQDSNGRKFDRS